MNYKRIYNEIITNRLNNPVTGYSESHHILPRSLGGTDDKTNIVELTAREHFLCHWLLVKIHRLDFANHSKMLRAFSMMCFCKSENQNRISNSRKFEKYRIMFSEMLSKLMLGEKNSQFGTIWICNIETRINKKVPKGQIPEGWIPGRNKWKEYFSICIQCSTEFLKTSQTQFCSELCKKDHTASLPKIDKKYKNGFKVSVNNIEYDSIAQAADSIGIGHETARMRFKSASFPEYLILSR